MQQVTTFYAEELQNCHITIKVLGTKEKA